MKKILLVAIVVMGLGQQAQGSFAAAAKAAGAWSSANVPSAILTAMAFGAGQAFSNQALIEKASTLENKINKLDETMKEMGNEVGESLSFSGQYVGNSIGMLKTPIETVAEFSKKFEQLDGEKGGWYGLWSKAKRFDSEVSSVLHMVQLIATIYGLMKSMPFLQDSLEEKELQRKQAHLQTVPQIGRGRYVTVA